jgi:N-acetylglucosamine kinase-like BadF-type ATPase
LFLGIDGGQSHTEAVVADGKGKIFGRGRAGASNHANEPGGRERLRVAVSDSASEALRAAGLPPLDTLQFVSVHCGMTGGGDFKQEVIRSLLRARQMTIGHDAPAALAGATGGKAGIVVIAGTGSVAYGENAKGVCTQVGGWGYLFGDEGGGFGIALETVRRAAQVQDGLSNATSLLRLTLQHFNVPDLRNLVQAVYSGRLARDEFAAFAQTVHDAALSGLREARELIRASTESLANLAAVVARNLNLTETEMHLFCVGGMFRGALFSQTFAEALKHRLPVAQVLAPRFAPVIGALLLAYRAAGYAPCEETLLHLGKRYMTGLEGKSSEVRN